MWSFLSPIEFWSNSHKNRKKILYIRYDLLVNSFTDSLLMSFHSSGFFSIRSTIPNIRSCSLRSLELYQIQQEAFYSEHPVKSFRFPCFSITIACTQMFTNYRHISLRKKIISEHPDKCPEFGKGRDETWFILFDESSSSRSIQLRP
jgi:hypothetical protein